MPAKTRISLGLYVALTALPLAAGLVYALGYSFGFFGLLSEGLTHGHWAGLLGDPRLYASLLFSGWIAVVTLALSVSLALLLAVRYRSVWGNKYWAWGLYLPLAFPAIVSAFIAFQLLGRTGFFARIAHSLGFIGRIEDFPILIQDPWGIGIIATHSLMAIPFFTLLFLSLYEKEGLSRYAEAARTLGAGARQVQRRIVLPILVKKAQPVIVLYGIFVAGAYEAPLLLGTQQPQMITLYIVNKINRFDLGDRPQAYAATALVVCVLFVLLWALMRGRQKTRRVW